MLTWEDRFKKGQEVLTQSANMRFSAATFIMALSSALFITSAVAQEINCADGASEEACEENCSCVCWGDIMHCTGDGNTCPPGVLQNCEIFCSCANNKKAPVLEGDV